MTVRESKSIFQLFLKLRPTTFNELTYTETYLIFLSCETNKAGNKYVRGCYNHIHIVSFLLEPPPLWALVVILDVNTSKNTYLSFLYNRGFCHRNNLSVLFGSKIGPAGICTRVFCTVFISFYKLIITNKIYTRNADIQIVW